MSGVGDRFRSFCNFLWNSEEKKVLGRGGRSWVEIGLFYLVYYACLAGFFVGMLAVFYQTVDEKRPKLTGTDSLLKANPGMGFQPMPDVEYTLVRFRVTPKTYKDHVKSIAKVLKPYMDNEIEKKGVDCSNGRDPNSKEACNVDVPALTEKCNINNTYGFENKQPCILLRLNKIFDWMPKKYTEKNVNKSNATPKLKKEILANPAMIYVECVGENPADRDNIGEIQYFPQQGFPHYYYPFTNQPGYMSPLVFVKFLNPPSNIALMVECRALAPNINYDRTEKEGGVHFELLMDP